MLTQPNQHFVGTQNMIYAIQEILQIHILMTKVDLISSLSCLETNSSLGIAGCVDFLLSPTTCGRRRWISHSSK